MTHPPRTMFEKVWDSHVVDEGADNSPALLYIDLHLIHEVTSPQAFAELDIRGASVHRPDRTLATMDHSTPTSLPADASFAAGAALQLETLKQRCAQHGIPLFALGDDHRGIVHVVAPERGRTQPGMTIVCGDSHTSTHGAFGAFAFGIGTTEIGHVLATQCLRQWKPKTMEIRVDGQLAPGVSAKDLILAIIAHIGVDGGTGHVIEYRGDAIRALDMEGRMTVCNMSIEAGARAGMIAPDEKTYEWLKGRPDSPKDEAWERALARWTTLPTDTGAVFDKTVVVNADSIKPMITWGTNPGMAVPIASVVPQPTVSTARAFEYMQFTGGQSLIGESVDVVFVGSCTNGRLDDLRSAARVLVGRKVAPHVRMLVVPGSQQVKRDAEREGLDNIFIAAGAEWRESGCSMCIAMNGDLVAPGQLAVSTSNRNFEGRQGVGARTLLASPATAAACAIAGSVTNPETFFHDVKLS